MASAEDKSLRMRNDRLDEDIQLTATNQALVIRGFLAQREVEVLGLFGLDDLARGCPDVAFHAAPANGAHDGAVFAHQHLRALVAGNGAIDLHDGCDGALLAECPQAHDFVVKIHRINYNGELLAAWMNAGKRCGGCTRWATLRPGASVRPGPEWNR